MPLTFSDMVRPRSPRAQQNSQSRKQPRTGTVDPSAGSRRGNRLADAEASAGDADKTVFLKGRKGGDEIFARHLNKPLPSPRGRRAEGDRTDRKMSEPHMAGQIERTPQELANLEQRRELRDAMVEAYGEDRAGAAFAHVGVALKGEDKFAPVSEATRQALQRFVPDRISQANAAVKRAVWAMFHGQVRLKAYGDSGLMAEAISNLLKAHPQYGKDFLRERDAYELVYSADTALGTMKYRLKMETEIEKYLKPKAGHDIGGNPVSLDQALIDYQDRNRQYARASEADVIDFKAKFRDLCYREVSQYFPFYTDSFLTEAYPKFSAEKREKIAARRDQAYLSLLATMIPRELAQIIAHTLWELCEREVSHPPVGEAARLKG